jgi:hypothetical protein
MSDPDDDDDLVDGLTWDEWMALSEDEAERRVDAAMREYKEFLDQMSAEEFYRHSRRSLLKTCLGWRKTLKKLDLPVFRDHLKRCQRHLLARRIQRRTGIYPGSA